LSSLEETGILAVFQTHAASAHSDGGGHPALSLTRRALLESASADQAADRARAMDGPAVGSFLVIDAGGRIRNLEIFPQGLAVIVEPASRTLHLSYGPPCEGRFATYTLA
jgi:hypothetical protein